MQNLDVFHITLWFHDHGLYPQHPELQEIEWWARLVQGMDGDIIDLEGNWGTNPRNIASMLEGNPALAELNTLPGYLQHTQCPGPLQQNGSSTSDMSPQG